MKIKIMNLILLIIFLFIVGCTSQDIKPVNENMETEANTQVESDLIIEEKKGVLSDTVKFGSTDGMYGEIKKHHSTKTAEIEMLFQINESEEKEYFFDQIMYMTPMVVNMMCGLSEMAFFEPERLKELEDSVNEFASEEEITNLETEEGVDILNYLDDYELKKLSITFIYEHDNAPIAKCVSTGSGTLEFMAYKDYPIEQSFMGQQIGILEEYN